jgi:hypothetical protein
MPQICNHGNPYPQPNFGQFGFNPPILQNPNNQRLQYPSPVPPIQSPVDLNNYINTLNQYQRPNSTPSKFFPQNFINPNRFQNYNPQEITSNYEDFLDINQREFLQGNLEYAQGYHTQFPNQINSGTSNGNYNFQEFNKNHLSDLFNPNDTLVQQSYKHKRKLFKLDRQKHEKMLELERDRYSLKATLKKLEKKFDEGSISESEYFKAYRNLNKEVYLIENKIQKLQQRLEELESLKQNSRSFDNKRFYT